MITPVRREATAAEMEAATGSTQMVTPRRVNDSPSASKGWVLFNGTGTLSVLASHNVSSVADNGTGDYTVNWNTDFSSASYCAVCSTANNGAGEFTCIFKTPGTYYLAGSVTVNTYTTAPALVDSARVTVAAFGDQ